MLFKLRKFNSKFLVFKFGNLEQNCFEIFKKEITKNTLLSNFNLFYINHIVKNKI